MNIHKQSKTKWLSTIACTACFIVSLNLNAQSNDDWEYAIELYGLAATTKTNTTTGDSDTIDFDEVLDALKFAAMGSFAAKKDKLSLFANLNYLNAGDGETVDGMDIDVDMEAFFMTLGAGWLIHETPRSQFNTLIGARYLDMSLDLSVDGDRASASDNAWDAVIGLRGIYQLTNDWYFHYYGDVGTGNSKSTWHLKAAIDYDFDPWTAELGYSYMAWKFDDQELLSELKIYGPYLGLKYRF